jgi:hypothetical protein
MVAAGSTDLGQRIVAYMERRNLRGVEIRTLQSCGSFIGFKSPELRNACQWLVDAQLGEWMNHRKTMFCLLANKVADLRPAATGAAAEQRSDDVNSTQESVA